MDSCFERETLTRERIISILTQKDKEKDQSLFEAARKAREKVFGNRIFLYGFVYFSTWCRNNCNFCYYRRENDIGRYRKSPDEIVTTAESLADSGVNLIDLTMGEDLAYHKEGFAGVLEMIRSIKERTGLPVMISPGVVPEETVDRFVEAGADWYALYQETHNRELFKKLRIEQDYDERMNRKLYARDKGMLIEEGLLAGVGETEADIADSLFEMGRIGALQMRVMSFVPQKGSPMENAKSPDRSRELRIIALMRLMYPHVLIPASLDVDGIAGLKERIDAGANVVTSIIPPKSGLMGVAHSTMDVDEGGRTAKEASFILEKMGLHAAGADEYRQYLEKLKEDTRL